MFKVLFIKELQNYLYSLRFRISFIIVLVVFVVGTVSFTSSFNDASAGYLLQKQSELAERVKNVTKVATAMDYHLILPRDNAIIADCKESVLPNLFEYNAYGVFDFSVHNNAVNPLLKRSESLNWAFIVSMFLSFVTLLFSFDSISGEKEDRTLALVFSNAVSRKSFLLSKLLSIVTVVSIMAAVGMIVSLIMLAFSGKVLMNVGFFMEVLGFVLVSLLFITVFASFGLLSSAITRYSNVSLLVSLCFWLFSAVIIPNTSVFWANKLFPIPTADKIQQVINEEMMDINNNASRKSFSTSGDPFYPRHELRADRVMSIMNARKKHADAYYLQMFQQFEKTRNFTLISPIAQFEYINEAFLGGGYLRLKKNRNDLHIFQEQFLQWFKDIDAKDPKSPHWYNPFEDLSTSRQEVAVDQVPRYQEKIAPFSQRFQFIAGYLIAMIIMVALFFGLCFYFFVRYDVR